MTLPGQLQSQQLLRSARQAEQQLVRGLPRIPVHGVTADDITAEWLT